MLLKRATQPESQRKKDASSILLALLSHHTSAAPERLAWNYNKAIWKMIVFLMIISFGSLQKEWVVPFHWSHYLLLVFLLSALLGRLCLKLAQFLNPRHLIYHQLTLDSFKHFLFKKKNYSGFSISKIKKTVLPLCMVGENAWISGIHWKTCHSNICQSFGPWAKGVLPEQLW